MLLINQTITQFIWYATLILVFLSLIVFFTLVFLRFFHDRRASKNKLRKKYIQKNLLIHLSNPLQNLKNIILQNSEDENLIAEIAPEILRNLKGLSYQRMLDTLKRLGLYEWTLKNLKSRNLPQKIAAIHLASFWPYPKIQQELIHLLKNKEPAVVHAALESLSCSKNFKLFALIIGHLKQQSNFSAPIISDLFQEFGSSISSLLLDLLQNKGIPTPLYLASLMALIRIGNPQQINTAAMLFCDDKNDDLRFQAHLAFLKLGKPVDNKLLKKAALDRDWRIRQTAAHFAEYSSRLPVEVLKKLLKDENFFVGFRSGKTLFQSGAIGAKLLQTMAQKGNALEARRAKMILAENSYF